MSKLYKGILFVTVSILLSLFSCSDPLVDLEKQTAQTKADSTVQANIDNEIIEKYILDNDLSGFEMVTNKNNTRMFVIEDGDGVNYPEVNDIISVHYTGKSTGNVVFDTSINSLAITLDSLAWVKKGVDVAKYMADNQVTIETAFGVFLGYDDPIALTLYSSNTIFKKVIYNYTPDFVSVPTNFVAGFTTGLKYLVPKLSLGGKGLVIIPSAVAYGALRLTSGVDSSVEIIPSHSVLIFQLELAEIRRQ